MMKRSFAALSAALLCLALSLSAGWLWQTMSDARYEASARLLVVEEELAGASSVDDEERISADEAEILSPEVVSAAAVLLQERGVPLPLPSPFDPIADYLVQHTRVSRPEQARPGEICICCTAFDSAEALQMAQAIVDAYLAVRRSEPTDDAEFIADAAQAELQGEHEQLTQAIERQKQAIDEMIERLEATRSDATGPEADDPAALELELGRVRQAHRDAARRLADARRDVDNQLPAENVAARITDLPTRAQVLDRLNLSKVRDELNRLVARRQKWSAMYGRNHPRMVEIRERIEALEEQLASYSLDEPDQAGRLANSSPAAIVLAAFENESSQLQEVEQRLVAHLDGVQERVHNQEELDVQLGEARQELAFLNGEYDRTQKQLTAARHEHPELQHTVLMSPALSREGLGPRAGLPMALSCVAGMALYLVLLWQIRAKWLAAEPIDSTGSRRPAPARRERFRSREEEQLMRLKLAARG
jgi:uncharacterized protein involved in exopolysaccharide biosynthesis